MPNGGTNSRHEDYNQSWCNERHAELEKRIEQLWGEEHGGIRALWKKLEGVNQKLWGIILGQVAIMGGLIVTLFQISIT